MIDAAANDALDALEACPCCLLGPQQRCLKTPYTHLNSTEIYSDMLKECFNIELDVASDKCGICEKCVTRLRDASHFKRQVRRSQRELQERLARALKIIEEASPVVVKSEIDDEDVRSDNLFGEELPDEEVDSSGVREDTATVEEPPAEMTDGKGTREDSASYVIAKHLAHIQTDIRKLQISQQEILQRLGSCSSTPLEHSLPDGITLPCDDNEALINIESWINTTKENNKLLVTYLSLAGGNKIPVIIRRILEKLFTNKLAILCNWTGKNRKIPLKDLELIKVIRGEEPDVKSEAADDDGTSNSSGEQRRAAGEPETARDAASDEDPIPLARSGIWRAVALSARSVSARARAQLAMTCSVRLERLRDDEAPHASRICHRTFEQESSLATHMKETHEDSLGVRVEEEAYTCDTCGQQFTRKHSLIRHVQEHTGAAYSCETCSKGFSRKGLLAKHLRTHKVKKADTCELYNKRFIEKRSHIKLKQIITGNNYTCHTCNKQFILKGDLKKHIRTHKRLKPFSCDICNKEFSRKEHLNVHVRIHTGQKPFTCDICNKQFTQKHHLQSHVRVHAGLKPYSCHICSKRFSVKNSMISHITRHTGQEPYGCHICNKRFTCKSSMINHIRIHTGQKPYSCDICKKQFTDKTNLITHVRTHTGQKPFSCDVCYKQFTLKHHLQSHVRIHTGQKPYGCHVCNKQFTQNCNLQRHVKIHTRTHSCNIFTK